MVCPIKNRTDRTGDLYCLFIKNRLNRERDRDELSNIKDKLDRTVHSLSSRYVAKRQDFLINLNGNG